MATRTLSAAGGGWNSAATWVEGVIPTSADDVVLPAGGGNLSLGLNTANCRSLTATSYTGTFSITSTGAVINVGDAGGGSLTLGSGMTLAITSLGTINMVASTGGTVNLTTAGKSLPNLTINVGASTTVALLDALTCIGALTVTAGGFNAGGFAVSALSLSSSNTNTRSITLGTSTVTATGGGIAWTMATQTNLTFSGASSTLVFSGPSVTFTPGSNQVYGTVNFTGSGTASLGASFSCTNLTRTGTAAKTDEFRSSATILTVTGTLTVTGNSSVNRVLVLSNSLGFTRTIDAANVTFTNVDFQDITITGAAAGAPVGTSVGDAGGNTGINFTAATTQRWNGSSTPRLTGTYLSLPTGFATTPDSAALSITGDIDIRVDVAMYDWTPSSASDLIGKWTSLNNDRSYLLRLNATGTLSLFISGDGIASPVANSSVVTSISDGARKWVRATWRASDQRVQFFTSDDGTAWTQLGVDATLSTSVTSIYDSGAAASVGAQATGSSPSQGDFYRAQIRNGIDGTVAFDADFAGAAADANTFTESSANAATVTIYSGGGSWSDATKWTSRVPLPQDEVLIGRAFAANQIITADMPRLGKDIDWTGSTGAPTWSNSSTSAMYGSLTLAAGMGTGGTATFGFHGRSSHTITTNGVTMTFSHNSTLGGGFAVSGSTYTLLDAFTSTNIFTYNVVATLVVNGQTCTLASPLQVTTGTLNLGTGTLNLVRTVTGSFFSALNATPSQIVCSPTGTIALINALALGRTFTGGSSGTQTYGRLVYTVADSPGSMTITGSNTFSEIVIGPGRRLEVTAGTTQTISSGGKVELLGEDFPYLRLPGVNGNYASTPDYPAARITGDIDLRAVIAPDTWAGGASAKPIIHKDIGAVAGGRSYGMIFGTGAQLRLAWSVDGTALVSHTSDVVGGVDGQPLAIRATLDVDNGAGSREAKFWTKATTPATANADMLDNTGWTQLGATQTNAVTSIFSGTQDLAIGMFSTGTPHTTSLWAGKVYAVAILDGIDGTVVYNPDFSTKAVLVDSFVESSAQAQTVTINGDTAKAGDGRVAIESSSAGTQALLTLDEGADFVADWLQVKDMGISQGALAEPVHTNGDRAIRLSNVTGLVFDFARSSTDTVSTASDTATPSAVSMPRSGTDTVDGDDVAARAALALLRTVSDTTSLTDSVFASSTYLRTTSDSTSGTDSAVRVVTFHRTAVDSVTGTDDVARAADRAGCVRLTTSAASGYVTLTTSTASGHVTLTTIGC